MRKRFWSFFAACLMTACMTFAQKPVSGTVIDEQGESVIGASVLVKGTHVGATTDTAGKFTIKSTSDSAATLMVSCNGTMTKEVAIKPNLKIVLASDPKTLNGMSRHSDKTDNRNGSWRPAFDSIVLKHEPIYNTPQQIKFHFPVKQDLLDLFDIPL